MIASDFRDAPQELTRFAARAQPPTGRHRAFGQKLRAASSVRISAGSSRFGPTCFERWKWVPSIQMR
jgi:hypothetical protein